MCSSLERLVEADGGGAVEDDVDAGGELLHILWADGQARLRQLAADGDDLLVEVWVVLPHSVKKLPDTRKKRKEKKNKNKHHHMQKEKDKFTADLFIRSNQIMQDNK